MYSCFSTTFKTSSRIDLAFANAALLACIQEASYLPSGLSDHHPLKLTIRTTRSQRKALWRLQPHWINNEAVHDRVSPSLQDYWVHNAGSASLEMTWDASKAHSRGQYISAVVAVNAGLGDKVSDLQHKVEEALNQYSASATVPNFEHLSSLRRELHLHVSDTTRLGIQHSRQAYFEHGDKNSKLLRC
ncbi:hypothetical protein AB205_0132850 [Aquarana catesbeiana]|uniref:Endonuclease/exonuclease/phosphatase domain-containing protein n=1 Tax=Aquarana catesbeiana TaxID=8400 RepID=A0A2G9RCK6_AQUCT|nr:hypothetical protein AB205_0132850 [Aquarana catesbeiana]